MTWEEWQKRSVVMKEISRKVVSTPFSEVGERPFRNRVKESILRSFYGPNGGRNDKALWD